MKIKKIIILIGSAWAALLALSFFWNYAGARMEQNRIALRTSRSFFDHIVITRLWNARHGSLYAPVTDKTQPNPYLDTAMRNIQVSDTLTLTKVNPAFMTRQISEIAMEREGVQFRITSLRPIRPQNKPTAREAEYLQAFEAGLKEKGMFIEEGGKSSYFYMAPLKTTEACLECHVEQEYQVDDIRGGISITSPFVMEIPLFPILLGHIVIGFAGLVGIYLAGGKLTRAYEIIKRQAIIDALTGVPNRRSFSESILREFNLSRRYQQPLSIIMCDVDNFKSYNDTYGHSDGDECLKQVAQAVKDSLKRPGDFCARYGGEEFVVLLPNTALDGALHIAETIRSAIEKMAIPHKHSPPASVVTISLGVATSEGNTLSSHEDLVKSSDLAMYQAKELGRNRVQFFQDTESE